MGCCYVYKSEEPHTMYVPATLDIYCADLVRCLIAQGWDPDCVSEGANNTNPVGTGTAYFECEVVVTRWATKTTSSDCDTPPPPPGPGWSYTGEKFSCNYSQGDSIVRHEDLTPGTHIWRISEPACIGRIELNNKSQMEQKIREWCLLTCAEYMTGELDMNAPEECFSDSMKEAEDAVGGLLVCRGCRVPGP